MKKTLYIIGAALLAISALSCSRKAEYTALPFVYFENGSQSFYESDGIVEIPVFANAETDFTVAFTTVDGEKTDPNTGLVVPNGENGVDYSVVDNDAAILRFSPSTKKQIIKVNIVDFPGVLTGNKEFALKLQSAGNEVSLGGYSTLKITIIDNDHPLKALFGEYAATDADDQSWTVTFTEKPNDYTHAYLDGIVPLFAGNWVSKSLRHYVEVSVSEDLSKITVPLGYVLPDQMDGYDVTIWGITADSRITNSGSLSFDRQEDGSYQLTGNMGFAGIISIEGDLYLAGSGAMAMPPITLVKK